MLTKMAAKQTDATCRTALQLATQLPEDIAEARAVLAELADLLEGYLIKAPREIWNRPVREVVDRRDCLAAHRRALVWTLVALVVLAPIAASLTWACGQQIVAGLVMLTGVAVASLVFGQLYGVVFSGLATVALNLLAIEPHFAFSAPTAVEIIRLIGYVTAAVGLPLLANAAGRWRAVLIGSTAQGARSLLLREPESAGPAPMEGLMSRHDRSSRESRR